MQRTLTRQASSCGALTRRSTSPKGIGHRVATIGSVATVAAAHTAEAPQQGKVLSDLTSCSTLDPGFALPMVCAMRDATGEVQSALVLGANSEIAVAVIDLLATRRLRRVVLAARDVDQASSTAARLGERNIDATVVAYDATDPDSHANALSEAGAVDVVIVAFGVLGPRFDVDDPSPTDVAAVNFVGGVGACHAAGHHLKRQGYGALVVLSSVAGVRTRSDNALYGASKAGLDAFASGLTDALHGSGVHVMTVRPGFVHTKLTNGMDSAPFSTTPAKVAVDIVNGLRDRSRIVWSPSILRGVFAGLSRLPGPVWRRLAR